MCHKKCIYLALQVIICIFVEVTNSVSVGAFQTEKFSVWNINQRLTRKSLGVWFLQVQFNLSDSV